MKIESFLKMSMAFDVKMASMLNHDYVVSQK
jgi:hypothetical protein